MLSSSSSARPDQTQSIVIALSDKVFFIVCKGLLSLIYSACCSLKKKLSHFIEADLEVKPETSDSTTMENTLLGRNVLSPSMTW